MAIFLSGATGFVGAYVSDWLLRNTDHELAVLVSSDDYDEGVEELWRALQLHMEPELFQRSLERICFIGGDLARPRLGISDANYDWLISNAESVLHDAAARVSTHGGSKLTVKLSGTLAAIQLARAIEEDHPLRRFTLVSAACARGKHAHSMVREDEPLDANRPDYNTQMSALKFCEQMVAELLPKVPRLHLRPSAIIGDSRFPQSTELTLLRALSLLFELPVIPFSADTRLDIVNSDWVGASIAELHLREDLNHETYQLSAGHESRTAGEIAEALAQSLGRHVPRFAGRMSGPFERITGLASSLPSRISARRHAALLSWLMPMITSDVVYDNTWALQALRTSPTPFTSYVGASYAYAKAVGFEYPYKPFPEGLDLSNVPPRAVLPWA